MLELIKKNKSILITSVISLILGALVFILYFGIYTINPFNTDWIYEGAPDVCQAHLGFQYFRYASWSFPLGLFNTLSYPTYTSILNTISIPLLAIPFKLLSPMLPINFQYLGIWGLSCFMFQSLVGMIIARRYTKNDLKGNIIAVLAGLLFTMLPVLPVFCFWHCHMICHYLILLSFIPFVYEKMTLKQTMILYSVIGFLTGTINGYILVMCGMILSFYTIMMIIKTKNIKYLLNIVLFAAPALVSLYIVGGFNMNAYIQSVAEFRHSFDLGGFLNSCFYCSFFMNAITPIKEITAGRYAGFAYFGLGILILVVYSGISSSINLVKNKIAIDKIKSIIILLLIFLSIIIAISPTIIIGKEIFEIPYPQFIIDIWSIFESTERFIWVACYAILIFSLCYIISKFNEKTLISIFLVAIFLQALDMIPLYTKMHYLTPERISIKNKYFKSVMWDSLIDNNNIKTLHMDRNNIFIYNIAKVFPETYVNLLKYSNKINISSFYFARNIKGAKQQYMLNLKNAKDSDLFILLDKHGLVKAFNSSALKYFYSYNGYIIARTAPINGMEKCKELKPISINAIDLNQIFSNTNN